MDGLELFEDKYPKILEEILETCCEVMDRSWSGTINRVGVGSFHITVSSDYVSGLEGFYTNTIEGSIEVSGELWYIEVIDVFCHGTEVRLELDTSTESDGSLAERIKDKMSTAFYNMHMPDIEKATGEHLDRLASLIGIVRQNAESAHVEQIEMTKENLIMTQTRSPKTVTILDNNKFVEDNNSVIFQVDGIFSGDDQSILLQIMAENDIPKHLAQYNESRVSVVDQDKQIQSGIAGFKLPPLTIRDLTSYEVSILIK